MCSFFENAQIIIIIIIVISSSFPEVTPTGAFFVTI